MLFLDGLSKHKTGSQGILWKQTGKGAAKMWLAARRTEEWPIRAADSLGPNGPGVAFSAESALPLPGGQEKGEQDQGQHLTGDKIHP